MSENSELLKQLVDGKIKFYELEKHVSKREATELRRKALERIRGIELKHVGSYTLDSEALIGRNIENMIGAVQVPLGIAGPVRINGDYAAGEFWLPLATTEGALVASINRGCSTINACGGANVAVIENKQTRAPCFRAQDVKEAAKFIRWVDAHFDGIRTRTEEKSGHLKLLRISPFIAGNNIYLRFECETGDAMGMNMITIGVANACQWIKEQTGVDYITVTGNMCADKKPSALNFLLGRGKTVVADALIPRAVVEEKLKTTPERFFDVCLRKNLGSTLSGSFGHNAHFANVFKAIFIATGQDEAHIVEGSHGITFSEARPEGLYVSVTIPCMQVGTVGGGTRTETAQECLKILGVHGSGSPSGSNSLKFAEIVGAAVLAGEISLIAAQAAHHLASAHEKMGR